MRGAKRRGNLVLSLELILTSPPTKEELASQGILAGVCKLVCRVLSKPGRHNTFLARSLSKYDSLESDTSTGSLAREDRSQSQVKQDTQGSPVASILGLRNTSFSFRQGLSEPGQVKQDQTLNLPQTSDWGGAYKKLVNIG